MKYAAIFAAVAISAYATVAVAKDPVPVNVGVAVGEAQLEVVPVVGRHPRETCYTAHVIAGIPVQPLAPHIFCGG